MPSGKNSKTKEQTAPKPMGRPKREGGRVNVTMQWPIESIARIDEAAHKRGLSRTEFVLREMEKVIAREEKRKTSENDA